MPSDGRSRHWLPVAAAGILAITLGVGGAQAAAGDLDPSFGSGGKVLTGFGASSDGEANAVAIQADGKIVAAGEKGEDLSGGFVTEDFALVRYTKSGSLDTSFGTGGKVLTGFGAFSGGAKAVAIQADGKIVAAGSGGRYGDFALARYTKNGGLDRSFGTDGKVVTGFEASSSSGAAAVAIQPDGKIVAAGFGGRYSDFALVRYTKRGSLDRSFGKGGKVLTGFGASSSSGAAAVAIQPDGKIVAAGVATPKYSWDFTLVRYTKNGGLDRSFGTGGTVLTGFGGGSYTAANAVAIQPDGRIVAAGVATPTTPKYSNDFALVRYTKNGTLDTSFGTAGMVLTDFGGSYTAANAVAIQPDGKIVAAGVATPTPPTYSADFALVRYTKNGTLDTSFGTAGLVLTDFEIDRPGEANAVAIQPDGKIVAAGSGTDTDGDSHFALVRYLGH